MPIRLAYVLPVLYAIFGALLWKNFGVKTYEIILWVAVQIALLGLYYWLIKGGATGLMMKFHLTVTGIGMILLFFVLMPWRPDQESGQILAELIIMGVGTLLCALGVYTLLYMILRKAFFHLRKARELKRSKE